MKKIILILAFFINYSLSADDNLKVAWVNTQDGVNLRKAPYLGSKIIRIIPYQTRIEITEFNFNNKDIIDGILDYWLKIKYQNQIGWVLAGYLSYGELIKDIDFDELFQEIFDKIKKQEQEIEELFRVRLNSVKSFYRELINTSSKYYHFKYGETDIGSKFTITININRFNNIYYQKNISFDGAPGIIDYLAFNKEYSNFLNDIQNKKILNSVGSVLPLTKVLVVKKRYLSKNIQCIEADCKFMFSPYPSKILLFVGDGYEIECAFDFSRDSALPYIINSERIADYYNKHNLFYSDNSSGELKLTSEGIKYMKLLDKLMIELLNVIGKY